MLPLFLLAVLTQFRSVVTTRHDSTEPVQPTVLPAGYNAENIVVKRLRSSPASLAEVLGAAQNSGSKWTTSTQSQQALRTDKSRIFVDSWNP